MLPRGPCVYNESLLYSILKYGTVTDADLLKMTIWETPAGIVDEGGVVLPAWLNFGITLLGPPANGIMHVSSFAILWIHGKPDCCALKAPCVHAPRTHEDI